MDFLLFLRYDRKRTAHDLKFCGDVKNSTSSEIMWRCKGTEKEKNAMRKEELRTYIENHESEMIEDLKSLIRIPSEKQAAEPGKPFGAPAAEALAQGIEILEKYGFAVTNYDN